MVRHAGPICSWCGETCLTFLCVQMMFMLSFPHGWADDEQMCEPFARITCVCRDHTIFSPCMSCCEA